MPTDNNYNAAVHMPKTVSDKPTNENIFNHDYDKQMIVLIRDLRVITYTGVIFVILVTLLDGFSFCGFNIDPTPHAVLIGGAFTSGILKMLISSFTS